MEQEISIAIDGPSGAGKSSIAKAVAKRLGITYLDTGAMYRGAALAAVREHVSLSDIASVLKVMEKYPVNIVYLGGEQRVYLGDADVSEEIRRHEISKAASDISKLEQVREKLVRMQREIAKDKSVVMDGRDIGSVVLPNADVKIYLTASAECRARRRVDQLRGKGRQANYRQILSDIEDRDENDMHRTCSPLVKAEGAITVDTTSLNFEQSVHAVMKIVAEALSEDK